MLLGASFQISNIEFMEVIFRLLFVSVTCARCLLHISFFIIISPFAHNMNQFCILFLSHSLDMVGGAPKGSDGKGKVMHSKVSHILAYSC